MNTPAFLLLSVFFAISFASAQTVVDTTAVMSDSVKIDALYCLPVTPKPTNGYPALVLVHGFGGSKEEFRSAAVSYASLGFATVAYSVRGQGLSEGTFDFFTSKNILGDLSAMITLAKALPNINASRVAVLGGSQGGIHAWNASAYDLGVRCVISIIANGRFDENWVENNALNWTFARTITLSNVRIEPSLVAITQAAMNNGDVTEMKEYLAAHSTHLLESTTTTPTLILVSYFDGFFNQNAALRQFSSLPAAKRIVLYPAGHSLPSVPAQRSMTDQLTAAWLAHWLVDENLFPNIASPDSAVTMFDAGNNQPHVFALKDSALWLNASTVLPPQLSEQTFYFSPQGLTQDKPSQETQRTVTYVNVLGSTPVVLRTKPFNHDVILAGTVGKAHLRTDGSGASYQMNLSLFDRDLGSGMGKPISRGHYQVRTNESGQEILSFDLTSTVYTLPAGHVLEAQLHGGVGLLPDQNVNFGNFVFNPPVASINTLFEGGSDPSRFTLHFYDPSITATPAPATQATLALETFPQPVTSLAIFQYTLPTATEVKLVVYNSLGEEVTCVQQALETSGRHTASWQLGTLAPGMYFCSLRTLSARITQPFLILR